MKIRFAFLVLPLLLFGLGATAAEKSVLFIGNSHTATNSLDKLFEGLALAGGHTVHVDRSTVGGSILSYHSHHDPTLALIWERNWDHVVIQEHSLLPVIDYWREESFYASVARLDSIITTSNSHTTLFLHWAREAPTGVYCYLEYCSREFVDYFDMQAEMSAAYDLLAAELDVMLVPVGDVWATALRDDPNLPLWGVDQLHPSLQGSYLAACVFYAHFFDESPVGLGFTGGLDELEAERYQRIAWGSVSVSKTSWGSVKSLYRR